MSGPVNVFLSDDPERDWPAVSKYLAYQWSSYAKASAATSVDVEMARARGLSGGLRGCLIATPEEADLALRRHFAGMPVETIFTWAWFPGLPDSLVERHLELWCGDLASRVADLCRGGDPSAP